MYTPFPQSYWLGRERVLFGHFPSDLVPHTRERKLGSLLDLGIRTFINLTHPSENGTNDIPFDNYPQWLKATAAIEDYKVTCLRFGFLDNTSPTVEQMKEIQKAIRAGLENNGKVYVHCWGGHGRSATVAACFLVDEGIPPFQAIEYVLEYRRTLPKNHFPFIAGEQLQFIYEWANLNQP